MARPNANGLPKGLRKDPRGYFIDYYYFEGGIRKRKRIRLGNVTLEKAVRLLTKHEDAVAEGKFLGAQAPLHTFVEAADSFLHYSESRKKTYHKDGWLVRRLKEFFGERPLDHLNLDLVDGYINWRRKQGRKIGGPLQDTTLNRELACLKTIVRRAVLNRLIDRNPIDGLRLFKDRPRDRVISPAEFQNLLGQCSLHLKPIVEIAYATGMRRGEILGLRWNQIDLKNKVIVLEADDTKTKNRREIPLDDALMALLQQIPRTLKSPNVFTFKGKRMSGVRTAFDKACQRAGIENFKFHDLRHCAVTNMRKAGVPDSVIMSISGHKTNAMFRRYDSVDREDRHKALSRLREWQLGTNKTPGRFPENAVSV
jgi:integrase